MTFFIPLLQIWLAGAWCFSLGMPTPIRRYNRIGEILEDRGTKQIWLARQCGVTSSVVSKWVYNSAQPRLPMLYRVAEVLGVSVCELLVVEEE